MTKMEGNQELVAVRGDSLSVAETRIVADLVHYKSNGDSISLSVFSTADAGRSMTYGRGADNDIQIKRPVLSRHQAVIKMYEICRTEEVAAANARGVYVFTITNIGVINPTLLNGRSLEVDREYVIPHNSIVTLDNNFRFCYRDYIAMESSPGTVGVYVKRHSLKWHRSLPSLLQQEIVERATVVAERRRRTSLESYTSRRRTPCSFKDDIAKGALRASEHRSRMRVVASRRATASRSLAARCAANAFDCVDIGKTGTLRADDYFATLAECAGLRGDELNGQRALVDPNKTGSITRAAFITWYSKLALSQETGGTAKETHTAVDLEPSAAIGATTAQQIDFGETSGTELTGSVNDTTNGGIESICESKTTTDLLVHYLLQQLRHDRRNDSCANLDSLRSACDRAARTLSNRSRSTHVVEIVVNGLDNSFSITCAMLEDLRRKSVLGEPKLDDAIIPATTIKTIATNEARDLTARKDARRRKDSAVKSKAEKLEAGHARAKEWAERRKAKRLLRHRDTNIKQRKTEFSRTKAPSFNTPKRKARRGSTGSVNSGQRSERIATKKTPKR